MTDSASGRSRPRARRSSRIRGPQQAPGLHRDGLARIRWPETSLRQRLAILLIVTLFALALTATWFMLVDVAGSDFASRGFVVVLAMLSAILFLSHLATAAAVLWEPRLGRVLGTLLGALAVVFAVAQVQQFDVVALSAGVGLIIVSSLPDGPPQGRTALRYGK